MRIATIGNVDGAFLCSCSCLCCRLSAPLTQCYSALSPCLCPAAGKSTLVGCLTRDIIDDGRGSARAHCFRHTHERETGRTSAISVEVMGMTSEGQTLRTAETSRVRHFQAVRSQSKRIITFVDLAGHEKYLKSAWRAWRQAWAAWKCAHAVEV